MKNIDFLPAEYREASAHRKAAYWRLVVLAAFAAVFLAAAFGQYGIQLSVERRLKVVNQQHEHAVAASSALEMLQKEYQLVESQAELLTYLRHPWPRTQILADVTASLPEVITLKTLRIGRESALVQSRPSKEDEEGPPKTSAAGRDLQRLRSQTDATPTVVFLEGLTKDNPSLHVYLGKLADAYLFSKVELTSIDTTHEQAGSISQFSARLVVRPGWGQPDGPAPAEDAEPLAGGSKGATR